MGDVYAQQRRIKWHRQLKGLDKDDHPQYTNIAELHTKTEGDAVGGMIPISNGHVYDLRPPSGKCWYITQYKAPDMIIGLKAQNLLWPMPIDATHQIPLLINYNNYIRIYNGSGSTRYFFYNGIEYDDCNLLAMVIMIGQNSAVDIQPPSNEYWYVGIGFETTFMFLSINQGSLKIDLPWLGWYGIDYKWYLKYPIYFHAHNANAQSKRVIVWGYKWAV